MEPSPVMAARDFSDEACFKIFNTLAASRRIAVSIKIIEMLAGTAAFKNVWLSECDQKLFKMSVTVLEAPNVGNVRRPTRMIPPILKAYRHQKCHNMDRLLREDTECRTSRQRTVNHIIGWANMLHPLPEIPFVDKMQLLKQFSPSFALLSTVQRSMSLPHLLLPNDEILMLSASHASPIVTVLSRILEELLSPLRRLRADQAEFSCLKALLLLNPDVVGLSSQARDMIREARDALLKALYSYLNQSFSVVDASLRVSSLLLIIPSLTSISQCISDIPELGELFGLCEGNQKQKDPVIREPWPISDKSSYQGIQCNDAVFSRILTPHHLFPQQGPNCSPCNTSPNMSSPISLIHSTLPLLPAAQDHFPLKVFMT
ncbi:Nuclear hormone receptor family member nhr-14 [Trichostrongylus colubriformis]|uniref:Nuclear hormone receptor family member nhr-14 n=1 Tax=Trichostrongylus colubriformis TaxID=6319 RepID=A0AAN8J0W0_TRICO